MSSHFIIIDNYLDTYSESMISEYVEKNLIACQGSKMGRRHFDESTKKSIVEICKNIYFSQTDFKTDELFKKAYIIFVETKLKQADITMVDDFVLISYPIE